MNDKATLVIASLGNLPLDFMFIGGDAEQQIDVFLRDAPAGTVIERVLQQDAFEDGNGNFTAGNFTDLIRTPPCNGCTACCRGWRIELMPWEEYTPAADDIESLWGDGNPMDPVAYIKSAGEVFAEGLDEEAREKMLDKGDDPRFAVCNRCGSDGCQKYDERPASCRTFNCAVAAIIGGELTTEAILAKGRELLRGAGAGVEAVLPKQYVIVDITPPKKDPVSKPPVIESASVIPLPIPEPPPMPILDGIEYTWSNRLGSRDCRAWLLVVKDDEVVVFAGKNIPGKAVIVGSDYHKDGKWSYTTYRLMLGSGVRAISGRDGWETGRFIEGLSSVTKRRHIDTWSDVAEAIGVSVPAAMKFLREWRPKAADALDIVDAQLEALDAAAIQSAEDPVKVTVSFGGPTNRMIAEGFWRNPKAITGYDGAEIQLIDPEGGWNKENITVVGISGTVISATHASGYHGGYVSVVVALVPGSTGNSHPER